MPRSDEMVRFIQQLISKLGQLQGAFNDVGGAADYFNKSIERMQKGQFISGTPQGAAKYLFDIGTALKLDNVEMDRLIQQFYRIQRTGSGMNFGNRGALPGMMNFGKAGGSREVDNTLPGRRTIPPTPTELVGSYGETSIRNVTTELKKYGYALGDVKRVSDVGSGALTRFHATVKDGDGIIRSMTVSLNRNGKVVQDVSRHFRSFGSALGRDIGEFLKWSIAAAVIYVPLRKINELFEQSIQIQSKLADVQISLGASFTGLNAIFESSADVARQMGVEVTGVIDGYVLAIRATGNIRNETKRLATAEVLLKDSMTLSKLSGMDQAKALDALVGTLRQLGMELDQGSVLLDKWVAVTRVANVDLLTLSSSFAIASTAAGDAGVDIDKLNGIIAALAESTILSGEETGNAIRGFIAGFQTEKSISKLRDYGIAVRDASGELRGFLDIVEEVVEKNKLGIISDRQLTEISNTLGGGYRRGAQLSAFFQNYSRAQEVAAVSAKAHGDAAAALNIKLETLQTSLTNLGNAFSELARALGQEGGFLDAAKSGTEFMTKMVDAFTGLVKILGTATPKILAFVTAWMVLRKTGISSELSLIAGAGGGQYAGMKGIGALGGTFGKIGQKLGPTGTAGLGGAGIGALFAAQYMSGEDKDFGRAGATIGAAAVGQMLAGGSPIGGLIGSTMASAFYDNFVNKSPDIVNDLVIAARRAAGEQITDTGDKKTQIDVAIEGLSKAIGDAFFPGAKLIGGGVQGGQTITSIVGAASGQGQTAATLVLSQILLADPSVSPEQKAKIREWMKALIAEASGTYAESAGGQPITPFGQQIDIVSKTFGGLSRSIYAEQLAQKRQDLSKGLINPGEFKAFVDAGPNIISKVSGLYAALGNLAETVTGTNSAANAFRKLVDIVTSGSEEEITVLQGLINTYTELYNIPTIERKTGFGAQLEAARRELASYVEAAQSGQQYKAFQIPEPIFVKPELSNEQLRAIVEKAKAASDAWVKSVSLDPDEQAKMFDSYIDPLFQIGDIYGQYLGSLGIKVKEEFLNQALEDAGALADKGQQLNIQRVDLPGAQDPQVQAAIRAATAYVQNTLVPLGYQMKPEDYALVYTDFIAKPAHADALVMQLALEKIINLNEKQLEGVFNLPEGMAALLPWTGKLFFSDSPVNQAAGGGMGFPYAAGEPVPVNVVNEGFGVGSPAYMEWKKQEAGYGTTAPGETQHERVAKLAAEWDLKHGGPPTLQRPTTSLNYQFQQPRPTTGFSLQFEDPVTSALNTAIESLSGIGPTVADFFNTLVDQLLQIFISPVGIEKSMSKGRQDAMGTGGLNFGTAISNLTQQLVTSISSAMPESIPVTTKITVETTNLIYIDSAQIQKSANKQLFTDFQLAKRRAGTVGYVVE